MNNEENRVFLKVELKKVFEEQYHELVDFIVDIAEYPLKSEFLLYEQLIRYVIQLEELKKQAKTLPYIVNTQMSVKIHPIQKMITDIDNSIHQLCKTLCLTRTSIKYSETLDMKADREDANKFVDPVLMLVKGFQNNIPQQVIDYIDEHERVSKAELLKFCKDNNIHNISFIDDICSAE